MRPYPAALGGRGGVLSSDGNVAVLSGDPARRGLAATAYVFAYSTTTGNYSLCPQARPAPPWGPRRRAPRAVRRRTVGCSPC